MPYRWNPYVLWQLQCAPGKIRRWCWSWPHSANNKRKDETIYYDMFAIRRFRFITQQIWIKWELLKVSRGSSQYRIQAAEDPASREPASREPASWRTASWRSSQERIRLADKTASWRPAIWRPASWRSSQRRTLQDEDSVGRGSD